MESPLGIGVGVMIAADAVVGLRLLLLARRTRRIPETAFGCAFILLGVVGYPLSILARKTAMSGEPGNVLLAAALCAQNLGCLAMYVATWTTFRPAARWGAHGVGLAAAAFALSLLGDSLAQGAWVLHDGGGWYYLGLWTRAGAFVWAAVEAIRYHVLLRRRLRIGLADPVIVDRFRLWAISSAAVCIAFLAFFVGRLLALNVAVSPPVLLTTSLAGLVAGVTVLLAFTPPAAYLRRVAKAYAKS
jgi:hypothetical protein